ncbi:hypothetical protein [Vibrio sp.]|uniref:hypothetical protein n=1 Tax=Vibrio sp. TaxID=678 RepID=UPI003D13789F
MKRHPSLAIVTAIVLFSLPLKAKSEHCDEKHWNQALAAQGILDSRYNDHAKLFNQFLTVYRSRVFLHDEFTEAQLDSFWQPGKVDLQKMMTMQYRSSLQAQSQLEQQIKQLSDFLPRADQSRLSWLSLQQHCQSASQTINAQAASRYVTSNVALKQDIELLIAKLRQLKTKYTREAEVLVRVHPQLADEVNTTDREKSP